MYNQGMPGKRATTPLFEVLQERQGTARAEVRPQPPADETPAPGTERAERLPAATPQGGFSDAPIRIVGGVVQMPMVYAAGTLALAISMVILAWVLGFNRGESDANAKQQLLQTALGPGSQVTEPGTEPPSGADNPAESTRQATPEQPRQNTQSRSTPAIGAAAFLTTRGPTQTDPRQDRHNYLQLGSSIRGTEMQSIIDLMASRDLECFGVIDPSSQRRNDGPLYVLFASRGFPSGQADSRDAQRYKEQVLAAGTAWKRAGGVKDFNDAVWALYKK